MENLSSFLSKTGRKMDLDVSLDQSENPLVISGSCLA
jgi:hypothetical protein